MKNGYEYYAFISYKREDEKWANWLQHKIEHFKLPSNLNGNTDDARGYLRPVFKDTSELTSGVLAEEIQDALEKSLYLIVICSPNAARSKWVNKEAQSFINSGRTEKIIPFIISGEPNCRHADKECFPQALLDLPASQELLGVNISELGRDAAAIKVIAYMLGLSFDSLWQREEKEKRKKQRLLFSGLTSLLLVFASLAFWIWTQNRSLQHKNQIITEQNSEIAQQYDRIAQSRDSILNMKYNQDIVIAKNYLLEGCPEMALVSIQSLQKNIASADSTTRLSLSVINTAIFDSLSVRPFSLVSVDEVEFPADSSVVKDVIHFSDTIDIIPSDDIAEEACLVDKSRNPYDTVYYSHKVYSYSGDCLAVHDGATISIVLKDKGFIARDIPCDGWFDFMHYPMAVSGDGRYLIYREGWRESVDVWWYDAKTKQKTSLKSWHGVAAYSSPTTMAGFNEADDMYFLTQDGNISVFSTVNKKPLVSLAYSSFDSVFWDDKSNLCVAINGDVFRWSIKQGNKNTAINVGAILYNVAISKNKKLCAGIIRENEIIKVWDISSGRTLYNGKIVDSPDDIEFANNDTELWVTSGYNRLVTLNLQTLKKQEVVEMSDVDDYFAPHHWECHIYITQDGRYCITSFDYGQDFRITKVADKKRYRLHYCTPERFAYLPGKLLFYSQFDGYNVYDFSSGSVSSVSEEEASKVKLIGFQKRADYDPELDDMQTIKTTAYKVSEDGTIAIDALSNGVIMIRNL